MTFAIRLTLLCCVMISSESLPVGSPPQSQQMIAGSIGRSISLQNRSTEIPLIAKGSRSSGEALAVRLSSESDGRRFFIVVHGLSAKKAPGQIYEMFVSDSVRRAGTRERRRFIGQFNFYDAVRRKDTVSLEITDLARQMLAERSLSGNLLITVRTVGTPEKDSFPSVDRIELVEQSDDR